VTANDSVDALDRPFGIRNRQRKSREPGRLSPRSEKGACPRLHAFERMRETPCNTGIPLPASTFSGIRKTGFVIVASVARAKCKSRSTLESPHKRSGTSVYIVLRK